MICQKICQIECQIECQKICDRMPEGMPDRMPEGLPVTKCLNVMVGITRSKVIIIVLLVSTFALRPGALYNFCVIMAPITKLAPMDVLALTQRGQKCLHGAFHHCESQFNCVHTCFAARSLSAHLIEPMRASSVCPC